MDATPRSEYLLSKFVDDRQSVTGDTKISQSHMTM